MISISDSTYQYISGKEGTRDTHDVISNGLPCVTVLIGAFDRQSGKPIAGVVNQPFVNLDVANNRCVNSDILCCFYHSALWLEGVVLVSTVHQSLRRLPTVSVNPNCRSDF